MKKTLIAVLCLFLAGCAGTLPSINNPVSNNALAGAISTYGILDSAVIAYRGLPRCTITHNFSATYICRKRSVLVAAQNYDEKTNLAINKAVAFQRNNPTLDASSYVTLALAAVDAFKLFAKQSNLPGVQ